MLGQMKKWLLRQVYPDRCPVCDKALFGEEICPGCLPKLKYVRQPSCMRCGKPLEDEAKEYCSDCSGGKHWFVQGKAVWVHQGAVSQMLYRYKYENRRDYTDFLASQASAKYGKWIKMRGIDCIMPIPLHKKKQNQRGYNQAELLARQISQNVHIPIDAHCLIRTRNTVPQKELSDKERKKNLKNAFKIRRNVVQYKKVLLVDDIYTTGSTIDAAAQALQKAGAEEVYFLCMSIGKGQ